MATTQEFIGTGRRKNAVASVRLRKGEGKYEVNGRVLEDYFCTESLRSTALEPLHSTGTAKEFDVIVKASGGGLAGQAGAVSLGIARSLLEFDPDLRPKLRAEGFLTRDPRMKERKKSGQPGARKRFQFSKR